MRRWFVSVAAALCLGGIACYSLFARSPADIGNNVELRQQIKTALQVPPVQTNTTRPSFTYKNFRITPRAEYDITARVFSTRTYHWNLVDDFFKAAPEDLALGWGPLSDYKYKKILHIRQEDRFFKYRWHGQPPFPPAVMIPNMANTHIVPANREMADLLGDVHGGDIVHMTGALIDITDPDKGKISTSLTRTDSGPGACEILWLESLQIDRH